MTDPRNETTQDRDPPRSPPAPPYNPRPEWVTYVEKGQDPDDTEER